MMSDTGDLAKMKEDRGLPALFVPTGLYGIPPQWAETYFELFDQVGVCLVWGHA